MDRMDLQCELKVKHLLKESKKCIKITFLIESSNNKCTKIKLRQKLKESKKFMPRNDTHYSNK